MSGLPDAARQFSLLVLEPDAALQEAISDALGPALPLVRASSGREALRLMDEMEPAMALVNLQLPDLGGTVVLKAIRERMEGYKVIVTSDSGDYDLVRQVGTLGVGDFLEKPYSIRDLFHSIDNSVRGVTAQVDFRTLTARYHERSRNRRQALLAVV
ncbi:MAG: response regulator [bacterium]